MTALTPDTLLYHVTPASNLGGINRDGLKTRSAWTASADVKEHYAEKIIAAGGEPIVLAVRLGELDQTNMTPDVACVHDASPSLLQTLGKTWDDVALQWHHSREKWQDSLEIVGSAIYCALVPASMLKVEDEYDHQVLHTFEDYLCHNFPGVALANDYPDELMRQTEVFLGPHGDEIQRILLDATGSGPFDGGCLLFAQAMQEKHGGTICVLAAGEVAQHAVLSVNGHYYDAAGAGNGIEMVSRFNHTAGQPTGINTIRRLHAKDFPDCEENEDAIRQIARLLPELLPNVRQSRQELPRDTEAVTETPSFM